MTKAWLQTLSGRAVTMAKPDPRDIDPLLDLPEMLARIPRFNGAVPGGHYSVAQHCVLIADAILDDGGDVDTAAIGLLHDAHEYIWGDMTTPARDGLVEVEAEMFGDSRIAAVVSEVRRRADQAIFRACGVPWPPTPQQGRTVKSYDIRMLATERRQMLAPSGRRWAAVFEQAVPLKMRGGITIWSIAKAADEYRERLIQLCPAVAHRSQQ
ncbi:hypothetical protein SAMN04488498_110194 [Mesorhizobium albiziae]|uniref:HD domain-containing protein n=1 Tax=Neomesorhizobium albiziae TaxID=335020 RepID=A0A1I4BJC3_9HYPH|nr:hypothetical protein [Mesorhizobium albiziae]GLS29926.1 hypothetical protein GCM10007937_16340 [Mesorhizobium albiziae]SFK68934.1 hypothetical protein SAMN04488498_110194 [Mesorhizobium albiziae]